MITLRRAKARHYERSKRHEVWLTFHAPAGSAPFAGGFAALEELDEDRIAPGSGILHHVPHDADVVTYVHQGTLAHGDSRGRSGLIRAGEFQCLSGGHGLRQSDTNPSRTEWAHVFQIWLRPPHEGLGPRHEQKRFSVAERHGALRIIASPDARRGSLRIRQDVSIYSAVLDPGQHVVHELSQGRSAWLHLVRGEVSLGDVVLSTGDGAGASAERAVSLTAREETEILLLDLGEGSSLP